MEPMIGEIRMFGGNFAPRAWALCQGQLLAISSNQALFSILGTTYGGDGRTTFGLPDLRGRTAISAGNGPGLSDRRLGARSGTETVTLNSTQMPSHSHIAQATVSGPIQIGVSTDGPDSTAGSGKTLAAANIFNEEDAAGFLGNVGAALTSQVTVLNQGGSQSHNNMQPYLVVNYIIALQGIFPSRN